MWMRLVVFCVLLCTPNLLIADITPRTTKFQKAITTLKREFSGIDAQIDQIASAIQGWYIAPELQQRPVIVNIWGLTGNGKTTVIRRLIELLDLKPITHETEMGTGSEPAENPVGDDDFEPTPFEIEDRLSEFDGQPVVLVFDEFQFARTIDAQGQDIRPIRKDVRKVFQILGESLLKLDLASSINFVKKDLRELFKTKKISDFFYHALLDELEKIFGISTAKLEEEILKDHKAFAQKYLEKVAKASQQKSIDLRKSLIFNLGNLDQAFVGVDQIDPDVISPDELRKRTSKITHVQIMSELQKLFRPEQVGRLGLQHVIFASLDNAAFKRIINAQLKRFSKEIESNVALNVTFDPSVVEAVLTEAVIAAKGVRPTLSYLSSVIESLVAKWATAAQTLSCDELYVSIDMKTRVMSAQGTRNGVKIRKAKFAEKIRFPMRDLRENLHPEPMRTLVAVHEAGHAIIGTLLLKKLPVIVRSRTSTLDAGGFVLMPHDDANIETKEELIADLAYSTGGYVAEEMVFGADRVSIGSSADIEGATEIASMMIRTVGFGSHWGRSSTRRDDAALTGFVERDEEQINELLEQAKESGRAILAKEQKLFSALASLLRKQTVVSPEELLALMQQYGHPDHQDIVEQLASKKADRTCELQFKNFVRRTNRK